MFAHAFDKIREVQNSKNKTIIEHLREGLGNSRIVKPIGPDSWIPVSKISSMCERHIVICYRLGIEMIDDWDPQGRWRADRGTSLHRMFQEHWMPAFEWFLGGWKCSKCGHLHGADENGDVMPHTAVPCPKRCDRCGKEWRRMDPFKYEEVHAQSKSLKVRGRIDGIIAHPAKAREVLDLKTTHFADNPKAYWSVARKPRLYDIKQLHWYMKAAGVTRGRLVYLDPGSKMFDSGEFDERSKQEVPCIVEHVIPYDPGILHREKEKVRGLREALKEKTRPVPACPHDRKLFGKPCPCTEVEDEWRRHGN